MKTIRINIGTNHGSLSRIPFKKPFEDITQHDVFNTASYLLGHPLKLSIYGWALVHEEEDIINSYPAEKYTKEEGYVIEEAIGENQGLPFDNIEEFEDCLEDYAKKLLKKALDQGKITFN